MIKFRDFRKRIAIQGAIAVVAVGVIFGVSAFIAGVAEEATEETSRIERDIRSQESQIRSLKEQLGRSDESTEKYLELMTERGDNNDFYISREKARDLLAILRNKYRLTSLSLTVGPEQQVADESFDGLTVDVVMMNVEITFGGITDQHIYSFLQNLRDDISGFMRVREFTVERRKRITNDIYLQVSRGGEPEMVAATLVFDWIGVKERPSEGQEEAENAGGM
ncbi:MAG: hypothetical protein CMM94_05660 [Rickettsiales bacterium]|nr:hypothetical protein [Rickettsiales bacterium]